MQQHAQPDDERYRQWRAAHGAAAAAWAHALLQQAGGDTMAPRGCREANAGHGEPLAAAVAADWAASGLMPLCGEAQAAPRRADHAFPSCARGALVALRALAGVEVLPGVDGSTLLSERAAYHGRTRAGRTSVNGQCQLLRARDGWVALNLARADDIELLPALLADGTGPRIAHVDLPAIENGDLGALRHAVVARASGDLVARAALLGLPIAAPGEHPSPTQWFTRMDCTRVAPPAGMPRVLDLSSLWAGPLAAQLLQAAGAAVTKLESLGRPDASREGLPAFHALLNAGKASVCLDLHTDAGLAALRAHIDAADIVIESARPRALRQFGIDAEALLHRAPGKLWLRIAGHDPAPAASTDSNADQDLPRVAFGDDAAIAGGAALAGHDGPLFCGDALADPLTGLHAAVAALAHWRAGRGALLTLSLAGVTRWCVERTRHVPVLLPDPATVRLPAPRPGAT
jgi:hypothetical protein